MPRISHERKQYFKSRIRAVLSRDHTISGVELAVCLKQDGLELERHYLGKLLKEIHAERINRADRQLLNTALAVFEDTITETMRIASTTGDRREDSLTLKISNRHEQNGPR